MYTMCADMELDFYRDFYKKGSRRSKVKICSGICTSVVTVRKNDKAEYVFIQNYAREVKAVPIPDEYEVLYGSQSEVLQPLQTKIIKKPV